MDNCEILERIEAVQNLMYGVVVPREFNEIVLGKLNQQDIEGLDKALNDIAEDTPLNVKEKFKALHIILHFSNVAANYHDLSRVSSKWLSSEELFDAGVDDKGAIVIWEKSNPEAKISMSAPNNYLK